MYMDKLLRILLVWVAIIVGCWVTECQASTVKELDVFVWLEENGSAVIQERWLIDLDDSDAKTEWYVGHKKMGKMQITDLRVEGYIPGMGDGQLFETLEKWNLNASREEKAGTCGLNNNGTEICWGFGDYGLHEYVVTYRLTHLIQSYDTNDGFNHCFVDVDCDVEQSQVTIIPDEGISLSEANTRRWAFGYEGSIVFDEDSCIVATPSETIGHGKRIIIMLEFDKGVFDPDTESTMTWAARKQLALEGADYDDLKEEDDDWGFWEWFLLIVVIVGGLLVYAMMDVIVDLLLMLIVWFFEALWWVVSLSPLRKWLRRRRLGIRSGYYYRDIKPEWSLLKNWALVSELNYVKDMPKQPVISAALLKLMDRGDISVTREKRGERKEESGGSNLLKIERPIDSAASVPSTISSDGDLCTLVLYMLTKAAGKDAVLQPTEFSSWAKKNRTVPRKLMNAFETSVDKAYVERNAADVFGLKAFLKDFTLLTDRHMMEVKLWDQYMVYAQFFGLTKQVVKDMKKVCPEYLETSKLAQGIELSEGDYTHVWTAAIYDAVIHSEPVPVSSSYSSYSGSSHSSSGYSSHSSHSGGGGYSGGGGGGGR